MLKLWHWTVSYMDNASSGRPASTFQTFPFAFIRSEFAYFHTAKTTQIDALRFGDKDLDVIGTLEYGQFGVVGGVNLWPYGS